MRPMVTAVLLLILIAMTGASSHATNGMEMIGYGARMSAMGGASLGMFGDTNLINTNPAGIATITGRKLDIGMSFLMPSVRYKNTLNDVDAENAAFPLPSIGFVTHPRDSRFAYGIGFYAQGGMGATYKDVNHAIFRSYNMDPTTSDPLVPQEYHSNIAYMKLSPSVSYDIMPNLSAGLALNVGYAMMEMKIPYSLLPSQMKGAVPGGGGMTFGDMFGSPMDQGGLGYDEVTAYADMGDAATATGWGVKLGFRYEPTDRLAFGVSYTSKSTLDFSGEAGMDMNLQFGDAYERMVMGALQQGAADPSNPTQQELDDARQSTNQQLAGMGIDMSMGMRAGYDVDIEFAWPREFGFGTSFQATDRLLLAGDLRWINWKDSMKKFTMKFSGGANPNINAMMGTPDGDMTLEMPLEWDNQVVVAFGAEYALTEALSLRGGFNYAPNPVPADTVIPIFPAIVESHVTLGAGYMITDVVRLDAAWEIVPKNDLSPSRSIIAREYDGHMSELGENVFHLSASVDF